LRRMSKQDVIREGHERRALAAGSAVGSSEIADDSASNLCRDQRRIERLDRIRRLVIERLPVCSDGAQFKCLQSQGRKRIIYRARVNQRNLSSELRQIRKR